MVSFAFKQWYVLPGGKTMDCLYDNGGNFTSFLLTYLVLVIIPLQY